MKRIMISGTNSGCGKTTVVCALLKALAERSIDVGAFKCGPDYIDPMFHSKIIGTKSYNLDSYFCPAGTLNYLLNKNSADMNIIEGAMGYYDGIGESHSACRTAVETGTPAVIVIDCKGMGASMGAVMKGFLTFRTPNNIVGFIFNRLPESMEKTAVSLCNEMGVTYFGRLPFSKDNSIESRHLGLVTADEIMGLKEMLLRLSQLAEKYILIDKLLEAAENAVDMPCTEPDIPKNIARNVRIALAYDSAFCFYYADNISLLEELGCEIVPFSPLSDKALPENIGGLILGGGYPELYAEKLSENTPLLHEIKESISGGLPVIAECGGFMYLNESIEDVNGIRRKMIGVINGQAYRTDRLRRFGYVSLTAKKDCMLFDKGRSVRAHEFHYWNSTACGSDLHAKKASSGAEYDCAYADDNMYAGYPHLHFYADTEMAVRFAKKCCEYSKNKRGLK